MSFNRLLFKKIEEIRRRLLDDISLACSLSRDGHAYGRVKLRRPRKKGIAAIATREAVRVRPSRKWLKFASLADEEIIFLGKLVWSPVVPYHALEALATATDPTPECPTYRTVEGTLGKVHQQGSDGHLTHRRKTPYSDEGYGPDCEDR